MLDAIKSHNGVLNVVGIGKMWPGFSSSTFRPSLTNTRRPLPFPIEQSDPESMLRKIESCRTELYIDPSFEMPEDVKKLRQALFKNEHKLRMQGSLAHGLAGASRPQPPSEAHSLTCKPAAALD